MDREAIFAISLMDNLVTATFVLNADGEVIIWNRACERLTGVKHKDVIGTKDHWRAFYSEKRMCLADALLQGIPDNMEELYEFHAKPSVDGAAFTAQNWCVMPQHKRRMYLTIDAGPVFDDKGNVIAVVETLRDMTDFKNAQTSLEKLASIDALTGIGNRRSLDRQLHHEWYVAKRQKHALAVIMIDIDYFKQYNDSYGHQQGDECLKVVANAIDACLNRETDLAFRYGGEEFSVLLPDTDINGAELVAERIRQTIMERCIEHQTSMIADHVTVSCGISHQYPSSGLELDALIRSADQALYQAKARGRNCCVML